MHELTRSDRVDTQVLRVQVAAHQLFSSDDSEEEEETP